MAAKPVTLPSFRWNTITEAKAAFKAILHGYELDETVTDPIHDSMLRELLSQHAGAPEKIGDGVDHFYIGRTQQEDGAVVFWRGRGIWIRRVDGSTTDFGYNGAITGPSPRVDAKEAMRYAIDARRQVYRERRYLDESEVSCSLHRGLLAEADAHVIYEDPAWEQLTFRFAQREGGWDNIDVTSGDGASQIGGRIAAPDVLQRWLTFFDSHANMQLACASCASRRPSKDEAAWDPDD